MWADTVLLKFRPFIVKEKVHRIGELVQSSISQIQLAQTLRLFSDHIILKFSMCQIRITAKKVHMSKQTKGLSSTMWLRETQTEKSVVTSDLLLNQITHTEY